MKCCDITPGMMKRRVSLQRKGDTPDGAGGVTVAWTQYAQPWASIKPKQGSEKLHSDRLDATGLSIVVMRYRDDVIESDKLVYRGKDYQIRSIVNIEEADRFLELTIERGVAQ